MRNGNSWVDIRQMLVIYILRGDYRDGAELPSVRHLVKELSAHHSTITRAYTALAHEGVIERRVGAAPVVVVGGVARLREIELGSFQACELPKLLANMEMLGLDWRELIALAHKVS